LGANPRAALLFHWDHRHRQVRAEGRVEKLTDAENDAYFRTRAWQSRLGAWASAQSEPVESRAALQAAVAAAARRFHVDWQGPGHEEPAQNLVDVPRPPHWGGFRLRAESVELWVEGEYRIHDRARWTRTGSASAQPLAWSVTRLQP
jgi:pyridoxamine 5'-phosphate oxidase